MALVTSGRFLLGIHWSRLSIPINFQQNSYRSPLKQRKSDVLSRRRFDFKVESITHHELLLLNLDGTPVSSNHDSSTGHLQVKHQHAMLRMGLLGLAGIVSGVSGPFSGHQRARELLGSFGSQDVWLAVPRLDAPAHWRLRRWGWDQRSRFHSISKCLRSWKLLVPALLAYLNGSSTKFLPSTSTLDRMTF